MPQIIPIRDLKKTSDISEMCHNSSEPIFVTKNGYGDMVVMSIEVYENMMYMNDIYKNLQAAEKSIAEEPVVDGYQAIMNLRDKYGI